MSNKIFLVGPNVIFDMIETVTTPLVNQYSTLSANTIHWRDYFVRPLLYSIIDMQETARQIKRYWSNVCNRWYFCSKTIFQELKLELKEKMKIKSWVHWEIEMYRRNFENFLLAKRSATATKCCLCKSFWNDTHTVAMVMARNCYGQY